MITLTRSTTSKEAELSSAKKAATSQINEKNDAVRKLYVTPISMQDGIYGEKEKEAIAYVAAVPEPTDLTPYPFISAEAQRLGRTVYEVAQTVLFMADYWRNTVGPQVEALRVGANEDVSNATTATAIDAVVESYMVDMGAFE